MARYGFTQLEALWQQAGGASRLAAVMAAIALAESGGRSGATHHNSDGSIDRGLWQINSVHRQYDGARLLSDPVYNAQAAVAIEHGSGLGAWTTYTSGAYRKYLPKGGGGGVADVSGQQYVLPYNPGDSKLGRIDQGVDISSASGFVAVAPGRVVHIDPNFYNGTPAVYIKLDHPIVASGRTYRGVYYSETPARVRVGQHVSAGQLVSGPGSAEIGFASQQGSGAGSWLPVAHSGYVEGTPTQPGLDFAGFMGTLKGHLGGSGAHDPVVSAATGAVSSVEAVAGFLSKLTDPHFVLRGLEVLGGGILVLLGLYLLAKQVGLSEPGVPNVPVVRDVAPPAVRAAAAVQTRRKARHARQARAQVQPSELGTPPRLRTRRTPELTEAAERRRAITARASRSSQSDEIPF